MTTPGLFLIPLSLLLILLPWRYSFFALFLFMMLPDVAVLIFGSFGAAPAFFYSNLMIARCVLEVALGRQGLSRRLVGELYPLLFFFALNIVVLWVALSSFQGRIEVITGTMGFNMNLAQPYFVTRENFTQIVYLAFHIALIYVIAYQLMSFEPRAAAKMLDRAVVLAVLFAAGIVFWELAAFYAGLSFPAWFFHSDTHTAAWGQVMAGDVLRASGSFSEPSELGFIFGGFILYAWKRYKLGTGSSALSMGLILICLIALAVSTATTAFVAMGFFALVAAKDMLGLHLRTPGARSRLRPGDLTALALLGLGLVAAGLYVDANWQTIDEILMQVVFEKSQTGSFDARTSADFMALDILIKTGGLGLGLGSHKPSSAVMTVLSNTGVLGFLAVGWFFFMRLKPPDRPRRHTPDADANLVVVPLQWLLIGLLFAHAVSNPNVNHTGIWMVSGLLIGIMASVRRRLEATEPLSVPPAGKVEESVGLHPPPLWPASADSSNAR